MRIIVFIFFLIFTSISLLGAEMTGKIKLGVNLPYSLVIMNQSVKSIPLYLPQKNSNDAIAFLSPKNSIKYQYQGDSGKWKYGLHEGKTVLVRSNHSVKGYLILNHWFLAFNVFDRIFIVSALSSLAFLILWLILMASRRMGIEYVEDSPINHQAIYHYNESLKSIQDVEKLKKEVADSRAEADHYYSQLQQQQEKTKQAKSKVLDQQEKFDRQIKNISSDQLDKLEIIKESLWNTAQEEAEQRHQVTVDVMRHSYSVLENKYNKVVDEAKIFGVDFFDSKYENILKGRRFELLVVKNLAVNGSFSILEWTPDKGFEAGVVVAANNNPDLVIRDARGKEFAIECKFRSNFFFKTIKDKTKEITWASDKQLSRYKEFSLDRNIQVLVAIGLMGKSSNPKWNYLINLNDLDECSDPVLVDKGDIQMICTQNSIYEKFVRNGDYGGALMNNTNFYLVN
jgi:hypothetical protein